MAMPWAPSGNSPFGIAGTGVQGRPNTQTLNTSLFRPSGFTGMTSNDYQQGSPNPITVGDMGDPTVQMGFLSGPDFGNLNNYAQPQSVSALSSYVSGMKPLSYSGGSYQAKDMSKTALPQYDAMRERLNTQYNTQQQTAQDSIDRQFAAMGGGPSGAQIKQTENLATSTAKQKGEDLLGINAEEAQARTGLQQQEAQKEFQSGESARGYGFQAGLTNAQMGLQAHQGLAQLDLAGRQAQQQAMDDEFNKLMAGYQAKHSGGLLGGGGFLGTGVGA